MEGKGRIQYKLLKHVTAGLGIFTLCSCTSAHISSHISERTDVEIRLVQGDVDTKALEPDGMMVTDINLLIFDSNGNAEECIWKTGKEHKELLTQHVSLVKGKVYSFYACANFGYRIDIQDIDGLKDMICHLAYPDEYQSGIPMCAGTEDILIGSHSSISMNLERLMAKISLRMDRSRLDPDVRMDVISARIGNCPRNTKVFQTNSLSGKEDSFSLGFIRREGECQVLNSENGNRLSGYLSLYMLENMQGEISEDEIEDCEKVFADNDPRRNTCSYIEMEFSYSSEKMYSLDKGLIYRFYLGEDSSNLDIERTCHYRISICPEGDGLSDGGWRVDKEGLYPVGEPYLKSYPSSYIRGDIGDTIHIWCDLYPPNAPFDVGENYMKADRETGIYDYEIDSDGRGATLTLTGPGVGLIYMEAGPPVNDAALFIIEVNLPYLR